MLFHFIEPSYKLIKKSLTIFTIVGILNLVLNGFDY